MLGSALTGLRTVVVLCLLSLLLLIGLIWGWKAMTRPFPAKADAPVCENTRVSAGTKVFPAQVVVTVLNASNREGLAGRTTQALTDEGFVAGTSGNAPKKTNTRRVQIWTDDPKSPAVRLVASWLHKPTIIKHGTKEPGVVVVVGEHFPQVSGGRKAVKAATDATICSPTAD